MEGSKRNDGPRGNQPRTQTEDVDQTDTTSSESFIVVVEQEGKPKLVSRGNNTEPKGRIRGLLVDEEPKKETELKAQISTEQSSLQSEDVVVNSRKKWVDRLKSCINISSNSSENDPSELDNGENNHDFSRNNSFDIGSSETVSDGLTGFIVTILSMLALILISWLFISQMDFFVEIFRNLAISIHSSLDSCNIFQGEKDPIKHMRRKLSFDTEKEN